MKSVLVGAETLLGREIREVAASTPFKAMHLVEAIPESEGTRRLTEEGGEALLMAGLDEETLDGAAVVFLAGSAAASQKAAEIAASLDPPPVLIDLTHTLEERAEARLRAPSVEPPVNAAPASINVVAHPAAIAIALFLLRLGRAVELTRVVVHVFEPASTQGQSGITELQQQTISLLSFKPLAKDVYDAQLAFNLLARLGEDAPESLDSVEHRIERHLATLLSHASGVPMPSLRLIQAPVFHGYSISIWAEFRENPGVQAISEALASAQIDVRTGSEEAPANVGAAGLSGICVGAMEPDRNSPQACWFWVVGDNLRIAADEALSVARSVSEPAT